MDSLPGRDGVATTKYYWKRNLKSFCDWLGKNPDQLIEERRRDLKAEDLRVQHRVELDVKRFMRFLEDQGKSPNYRLTYYTAIRSFYNRNYLPLQFMRREGPPSVVVSNEARAATKEEVRKLLDVSDTKRRGLILFLKDTGLAESDVVKLKIGDLGVKSVHELYEAKPPLPIVVRRKKTGIQTLTFMGKESLDALKTTLRMREAGSPERQIRRHTWPGVPPETLTLDSPLWRS
jgi:integrase